jgi:hypothetical protein
MPEAKPAYTDGTGLETRTERDLMAPMEFGRDTGAWPRG